MNSAKLIRRPIYFAILLGMLTVLALPPLSLLPMVVAGVAGFGWLLGRARNIGDAARIGWGFFFGYYLLGLYWISFSLLTDIDRYWWMIPFSATILPAALGVFGAVIGATTFRLGRSGPVARWAALAGCWTLVEFSRGFVFTGFPWNLIGSIWIDWTPIAQIASVIGPHGLGFLTVLTAGLPMLWHDFPRRRGLLVAAMIVPWLGIGLWGMMRLNQPVLMVDHLSLRLVQPNIDMAEKRDRALAQKNLGTLLRLSNQPPDNGKRTVVIWPESAIPYVLSTDVNARQALMQSLPFGAWLVTGAPYREPVDDDNSIFYNSLYILGGNADIVARFDKSHLVPFGEYMPLRQWLPLDAIAAGAIDFSPGQGARFLQPPGLPPLSPLICYEVIFPGAVTDPAQRPQWLVNVTNDAWFGHSAGPHQHFAAARMRSIEEGLPLVRVANTGISGVIDPFGRVTAKTRLGEQSVLVADLPQPLPPTPYTKWRDWPVLVLIGVYLAGIFFRKLPSKS